MNLLLDTHILLWVFSDDKRLTAHSRRLISEADAIYVSSVSIFEIVIKTMLKKLHVDISALLKEITRIGFIQLPLTFQHVIALQKISSTHKDPFDRLLVAQSAYENLAFLTTDKSLKNYTSSVIMN